MLNNPFISPWPFFEAEEIEAATNTLSLGKVNYWTGDLGRQFEIAYAASVGKKYGIALSNGTVALEIALRVLNVGVGDEVIVTSRSYVASASCVLLVGATPVFADVDFNSGNITAETIKPLITDRTKAIIPVHVAGWPCEMPAIMALAKEFSLQVIEDCAQAHGAYIASKPVGAWGHAAIFSFCQDKIISTGGEGGMLLLDNEAAYKQAWAYKDIGRSFDAVYHQKHPEGFRWLTESVGSNFRMTEFQAAIGLKQLEKLPNWIQKRNHNANIIIDALNQFDFIETPIFTEGTGNLNAYYRLYARVKPSFTNISFDYKSLRDAIVSQLMESGVPCFFGACAEVYREKVFVNMNCSPDIPYINAKFFADNAFCFLVHHTITETEIQNMAALIKKTLLNLKVI